MFQWKKLSDDDKKRYEEEATRIAQEREKADAATGGKQALLPGQIRIYCCKWKECDYQFETSDQLYDHITTVHTSQIGKRVLFSSHMGPLLFSFFWGSFYSSCFPAWVTLVIILQKEN